MKIKSLKIGSHDFSVGPVDRGDADLANCEGYTDVTRNYIRVRDDLPTTRQAETLIHEIMHAVLWDSGLAWNDKRVEKWILQLSPRVAALLRDNPKEMKLLIDLFKDAS